MTAIHLASEDGHSEIVSMLIENKANLESLGEHGRTPFLVACIGGDVETLNVLKKNNCNTSAKDKFQNEALHLASWKGKPEAVDWILKNLTSIRIDEQGQLGRTALHMASVEGHSKIVSTLLKNGADFKSLDMDGRTPLQLACSNGDIRTMDFLMKANSNTIASDRV
eukprot:m.248150 g.248150  ORF g.248150 m.248150 type:complete len:167 (+) comp40281_c1_seq32:1831-2331(+)